MKYVLAKPDGHLCGDCQHKYEGCNGEPEYNDNNEVVECSGYEESEGKE